MNSLVKTVTPREAAQVANRYVASFHFAPHEPEVMLAQVTELLMTVPPGVLRHVCNSQYGAITKSDRPCLKTLNKWITDWTGREQRRAPKNIAPLEKQWVFDDSPRGGHWEEYKHRAPTPQEEERVKNTLRNIRLRTMFEKTKQVKTIQQHDPKALLQALDNLGDRFGEAEKD